MLESHRKKKLSLCPQKISKINKSYLELRRREYTTKSLYFSFYLCMLWCDYSLFYLLLDLNLSFWQASKLAAYCSLKAWSGQIQRTNVPILCNVTLSYYRVHLVSIWSANWFQQPLSICCLGLYGWWPTSPGSFHRAPVPRRGCVFSPLLFTMLAEERCTRSSTNHIVKLPFL